jgi:zinc D-Ala-D-Ala carboxypeptidase
MIINIIKSFFLDKDTASKPTTTVPEVVPIQEETNNNVTTKKEVMSKISEYVSMNEFTYSPTAESRGLDNTPTDEQLVLIKALCENVFDKLREHTGKPIKVNSGFRGPELNEAINGASGSQHCVGLDPSKNSYGAAMDIDDLYWKKEVSEYNNTEMGDWIRLNLDYDQLIYEKPINGYPSWIHVSYRPEGKNRKENLIYLGKGKGYIPYEGNEHLISNPDLD